MTCRCLSSKHRSLQARHQWEVYKSDNRHTEIRRPHPNPLSYGLGFYLRDYRYNPVWSETVRVRVRDTEGISPKKITRSECDLPF